MTDDPLLEAATRYAEAARETDHRREEFYRAIREARAAGKSLREIGKATGLSHSRVQQVTE